MWSIALLFTTVTQILVVQLAKLVVWKKIPVPVEWHARICLVGQNLGCDGKKYDENRWYNVVSQHIIHSDQWWFLVRCSVWFASDFCGISWLAHYTTCQSNQVKTRVLIVGLTPPTGKEVKLNITTRLVLYDQVSARNIWTRTILLARNIFFLVEMFNKC